MSCPTFVALPCRSSVSGPAGAALRGGEAIEEHGDAKLTDLLLTLANCKKARSVSIHDRCKAVFEGLISSATRQSSPPGARAFGSSASSRSASAANAAIAFAVCARSGGTIATFQASINLSGVQFGVPPGGAIAIPPAGPALGRVRYGRKS